MTGSSQQPWSNDPNAPRISRLLYFAEKANFAGVLLGAMCYGIVVALFFQCMNASLYPTNRTKGDIKWGLVVHTSAMFSFATVAAALGLDLQSISYTNDRAFPGFRGGQAPGPMGYQLLVYSKAINVVPNLMFVLNQLLADGLLLYRCYIIYTMKYWIVGFPFLMYLATLTIGVMLIYQTAQPHDKFWSSITVNFGVPYFSISLALNFLLTLMIVVRLVMHSKNIRNAMGAQATGATGLYKTIATVLIESSALYTISYLLFIGPWGSTNYAEYVFFPALAQIQVVAPFLIILRVFNRSALTSDTIVSGIVDSIHFRGQEGSTSADETLSDGHHPAGSLDQGPGEP